MPYKNRDLYLYTNQKNRAKARSISFDLTFDDWINWWEKQLGPSWREKRGRAKNKYVMLRINDAGPYAHGNIVCGTFSQNSSDKRKNKSSSHGVKNSGAKLTEKQVLAIYKSHKSHGSIAKEFGISVGAVFRIKNGNGWSHLLGKMVG